jgi:hypothetical protein
MAVARSKPRGMYADGGGLYLQVSASGSKSWVFRYTANGKKRDMGLGAFHAVSLAEARLEADKCRQSLRTGIDPIEARKAVRDKARLEAVRSVTFAQCAEGYIKAHQIGWRNEKHASQWKATLSTYAEPTIGALPVDAVAAFAGASRPFLVGRRRVASGMAKTQPAGKGILKTFYLRVPSYGKSSITRHYHMIKFPPSSLHCGNVKASRRVHLNF